MIEGTDGVDRPVAGKRWLSRQVVIGATLAVLAIAGSVVLFPSISRWMSAERSVELSRLRLGTVERGDLERDLSVQGRIVAAYHPAMFSPVSGIVKLEVRAGDVVEKGQVMAEIDGPELRSRLKQAQSTLLSLQSDLEHQKILARQEILSSRQQIDLAGVELEAAQRARRRAEQSRREGIVNEVEYEQAQDDLRRAELGLAHAEQDAELEHDTLEFETRNRELQVARQRMIVDELQRQVDDLTVRAPVSGLVSRLDVNDHDAVTPAQPLVTVVDLSAFEIEVMVPENYADEIGPGTPAQVRVDNEEYAGAVKSISPEVEGSQVRGIVAFSAGAPQGLRQNQRVSTRLILESRLDVLKVPRGPFLEGGGGHQAYVLDGNVAVLRPIQIGALSVTEIEIVAGLEPGDRVILSDTTRFEKAERIYLRQ